jgi:hypothetical protein
VIDGHRAQWVEAEVEARRLVWPNARDDRAADFTQL